MRLSEEQLAQYRSEGFAKGGRVLNDSELAVLRREIDQLIASLPAGQRPENMPSVHYRNEWYCQVNGSQSHRTPSHWHKSPS